MIPRLLRAWRVFRHRGPYAEVYGHPDHVEVYVYLGSREHVRRYPARGDAGMLMGALAVEHLVRLSAGIEASLCDRMAGLVEVERLVVEAMS